MTLKYRVSLAGLMVAMAATFLGCVAGRAPTAEGVPAFEGYLGHTGGQEDGVSLFKGDSAILSDADIARILSFSFTVRPENRLAVLALGRSSLWSEESVKSQTENTRAFLDRLKAARTVREVAELPMLLVPEKQTVAYLREAGARFQADLLLVYQPRVRTFSKYRTLGKDEVKALCTVEAVLIDVRTGIIPYTTSASETILASRSEGDLNFGETIAKATVEAVGKAMNAVAENMATYLNSHGGT